MCLKNFAVAVTILLVSCATVQKQSDTKQHQYLIDDSIFSKLKISIDSESNLDIKATAKEILDKFERVDN